MSDESLSLCFPPRRSLYWTSMMEATTKHEEWIMPGSDSMNLAWIWHLQCDIIDEQWCGVWDAPRHRRGRSLAYQFFLSSLTTPTRCSLMFLLQPWLDCKLLDPPPQRHARTLTMVDLGQTCQSCCQSPDQETTRIYHYDCLIRHGDQRERQYFLCSLILVLGC